MHDLDQLINDIRRSGVTQRELAIASGCTEGHISKLLSGKRLVTPQTARKLRSGLHKLKLCSCSP